MKTGKLADMSCLFPLELFLIQLDCFALGQLTELTSDKSDTPMSDIEKIRDWSEP